MDTDVNLNLHNESHFCFTVLFSVTSPITGLLPFVSIEQIGT
jgi:hypothetical protein